MNKEKLQSINLKGKVVSVKTEDGSYFVGILELANSQSRTVVLTDATEVSRASADKYDYDIVQIFNAIRITRRESSTITRREGNAKIEVNKK